MSKFEWDNLKDFLAKQWKHYFPYAVMIASLVVTAIGSFMCGLGALVAALNGRLFVALVLLILTGVLIGASFLVWCLISEFNVYYDELIETERRKLREQMYTESAVIKKNRNEFEMKF